MGTAVLNGYELRYLRNIQGICAERSAAGSLFPLYRMQKSLSVSEDQYANELDVLFYEELLKIKKT